MSNFPYIISLFWVHLTEIIMFSKVWYHVPMFGVAPLTFGNTTFYEKFAYITYQAYRLNETWHA
jgi:hypothetical protein